MEDYCTPIIDKETFDKLQFINQTAPRKTSRPGAGAWSKDRALLCDFCYCGICGEKAYINRRKSKGRLYETYYCNHKHAGFARDVLEDLILEKAREMLSGEQWESTKAQILTGIRESESQLVDKETVQAEISKIDAKVKRFSDMLDEAGLASRVLLLKIADLEAQRQDLQQRLKSAGKKTSIQDLEKTAESLRESILNILDNEKSSTNELRTALSLFISAVILYPDGKVIVHHTLPGLRQVESSPTVPYETVESESPHNLIAPPEGGCFYSQREHSVIYVFYIKTTKRRPVIWQT